MALVATNTFNDNSDLIASAQAQKMDDLTKVMTSDDGTYTQAEKNSAMIDKMHAMDEIEKVAKALVDHSKPLGQA